MRLAFVVLLLATVFAASSTQRRTTTTHQPSTTTSVPLKVFEHDKRNDCQEVCRDPCQQISGPTSPLWVCTKFRGENEEKSIFKPKTLTERIVLLTFVVIMLTVAVVLCGFALFVVTCWTHCTVTRRPGVRNVYGYDLEKSIRL